MKHHICRPNQFLAAGLPLRWGPGATQPWLVPTAPGWSQQPQRCLGSTLTPADDDEDPQVVLVGEEGHEDQAVQVETFHQDPVVVGGQKIEEESHHHLAANLRADSQRGARTAGPASNARRLLLSGQPSPGHAARVAHVPPLAGSCISPGYRSTGHGAEVPGLCHRRGVARSRALSSDELPGRCSQWP